ncbi:PhzF family isomerase [candidate division KSB1 bacterium]|nr:PhzF family isomerase [candidate division KSB1 bacterium]NIR69243.1 PhzF family isomerase [candidate division KSB1 bacterium]NIS27417.1 PhzF family isomerase [candidate division KSB1 bacterium]NIT74242.1 PhzF family isomerase [candidate division KSB1 bacterium]NIU28134.1 PhzF family isomerase [candidate division KSB1 bacterium]
MSKKYKIYQVDAFTREKFKGNPAGVVLNADGLTDAQMQSIARELNNSETAFLFQPESQDHDVRIRFFTPSLEVPSCGHATIAAHYVRAIENHFPSCQVWHKINIGTLPVAVVKDEDYRIVMTQAAVEFLDIIEGKNRETLLSALQLTHADLVEGAPIQIVSTGHSKVIIALKHRDKLHRLHPDLKSLRDLSQIIGCNGYFIFTLDTDEPGILSHARMFAPAIGISEDPVTGNGNGPLGAYLVRYGLTEHDGEKLQFTSKQGEAMGRPGSVQVTVGIEQQKPVKVKVAGHAVIVFKTEIEI